MASSPPRKGRHRLVRQLRSTYESIVSWDESLREAANAASLSGNRALSSQAAALLTLLQNARQALTHRLAELGVEDLPTRSASPFTVNGSRARSGPPTPMSGEAMYLAACQACGRALGAAFREAQAAADAASARVLYGSLREFEKQLWVLDPCQAA